MSCRKFCNLVLEWLLEKIDPEAWDKEYKDVFFGDPVKRQKAEAAKKLIKPAVPGQQGHLDLKPVKKVPAADVASIIGKYGKGIPTERRGPSIVTGPDGTLDIDRPEPIER